MGDIFKLETHGYGTEIHGNTISRARIAPQGSQCESNGVHLTKKHEEVTKRGKNKRKLAARLRERVGKG